MSSWEERMSERAAREREQDELEQRAREKRQDFADWMAATCLLLGPASVPHHHRGVNYYACTLRRQILGIWSVAIDFDAPIPDWACDLCGEPNVQYAGPCRCAELDLL